MPMDETTSLAGKGLYLLISKLTLNYLCVRYRIFQFSTAHFRWRTPPRPADLLVQRPVQTYLGVTGR